MNYSGYPLFKTVYFEVRSRCNGRCAFCLGSVDHDDREDISMSFSLYASVIQQLKDLEYTGRISYHVTNEPLLFKELDSFISYARQEVPNVIPDILTNGILLTEERAQRLIDSGIKELYVNHYTKIPECMPQKLINIGRLCSKANVLYEAYVRYSEDVLNSRGGTSPNKKPGDIPFANCMYPLVQMNINGKGLVSKCCADVRFSDPMGDVTQDTLVNIWNGPKFTNVREKLLLGARNELPGCRECDFNGYTHVTLFDNELTNKEEIR